MSKKKKKISIKEMAEMYEKYGIEDTDEFLNVMNEAEEMGKFEGVAHIAKHIIGKVRPYQTEEEVEEPLSRIDKIREKAREKRILKEKRK